MESRLDKILTELRRLKAIIDNSKWHEFKLRKTNKKRIEEIMLRNKIEYK